MPKSTKKHAEKLVDRFLASNFVARVKLLGYTGRRVVLILVPLAVATYLLHTQADRLVLGLGVSIGLIGLINIVTSAYRAEKYALSTVESK